MMKIDAIETRPLTPTFGIEVLNVDLTNVTEDGLSLIQISEPTRP